MQPTTINNNDPDLKELLNLPAIYDLSECPLPEKLTLAQRIANCFNPSSQFIRPVDFDARQKLHEKMREKEADIRDNTLFWRVTSDDLGWSFSGEKPTAHDFIVGICDGKLQSAISSENLRHTPVSAKAQVALGLGLTAATAASYIATGEGVVTKGLVSTICSFVLPKLQKIPYIPQIIGPAAATTAAYFVTKALDGNTYLKFTFVAGMGLCAILYKRGGKALATGGWAAFKKYVIPMGFTETAIRSLPGRCINWIRGNSAQGANDHVEHSKQHQFVARIPITPISEETINVPAFLELTAFDADMYYALVLGDEKNEKKFPPIKMATKNDDDDDDDDDDEKKVKVKEGKQEVGEDLEAAKAQKKKDKKAAKKEKKKNKNASILTPKELVLMGGSGIATVASKYFLGEGIITTSLNTICSASVKAKFRMLPFLNCYGILTLVSGATVAVKAIYPDSFWADLYFIPVSILISTATKDIIKDRILTGKDPKNSDLYAAPLFVKNFAQKFFGWRPMPIVEKTDPLEKVIGKKNNGSLEVQFNAQDISPANPDEKLEAVLKIDSKKLTGFYKEPGSDNKLNKKKQAELHLARLKAQKLGAVPQGIFIGASIGATLLSSYLTRLFQGTSIPVGDPTNINAQNLGEGVITNILNSVLSTFLKQVGKKIPPIPRDGGFLVTSVGAIALERFLMTKGDLPVLFSSIPTSAFLAIQAKRAKQWVYGKPYYKGEGWITPNRLTRESLKKLADRVFCCRQEQSDKSADIEMKEVSA